MIASYVPPDVRQDRVSILASVGRARDALEELHRARFSNHHPNADLTAQKECALSLCRDDLDRQLAAFVDGEYSVEIRWRSVCLAHTSGAVVANESDKNEVRDWFDHHAAFLDDVYRNPLFASLDEMGFSVPNLARIPGAIEATQALRDRILERWPLTTHEFAHGFPVDVEEVVYIGAAAFLRSVAAVVWNAFRHPFSTTYIDLSTGETVTIVDEAA